MPDGVAAPIGVFDSGIGGLTVLSALMAALPHERFVYLGDTARLPYGTKSAHSVARYAMQAAEALVRHGIKCLSSPAIPQPPSDWRRFAPGSAPCR